MGGTDEALLPAQPVPHLGARAGSGLWVRGSGALLFALLFLAFGVCGRETARAGERVHESWLLGQLA